MPKNVKKRYWCAVVYPESLPDDWQQILIESGLSCAISPLHDKDIDPTGEPKKPHYHVILCYSGPTTFNVVKALTERLNAPHPQPLDSVKGYYRYLTHKDNPEKAQYDESKIKVLGGFDIGDFIELTSMEISRILIDLTCFCIDQDIDEYADLMTILTYKALDENATVDDLNRVKVAQSHTVYLNTFVSSRRNKAQKKAAKESKKV